MRGLVLKTGLCKGRDLGRVCIGLRDPEVVDAGTWSEAGGNGVSWLVDPCAKAINSQSSTSIVVKG